MPAPLPAVVMLVTDDTGRLLVIRRAEGRPRAGWWSPPTGRVEPGETEPEAVTRELGEEVGLRGRAVRRVFESRTDDGCYALGWWLCSVDPGPVIADPREVAEWRWVDLAGFEALRPVFASHLEFLRGQWPQ
jgi:8-oxo-dGTP diphosphatase